MNFETIFNSSYQRNVVQKSHLFFTKFYEKFISSSQQVRKAFKNTDMNRQQDMLKDSLERIIEFASTKTSNSFLQSLALVHKQVNNIEDNMYDLWLEAILTTLQEIDPEYKKEDELAWKIMLSPGIEFMKGFPKR